MMKFSIKKDCPLDENKLRREVREYYYTKRPPYIFVNRDTLAALESSELTFQSCDDIHNSKIAMYCGYKIFVDNTLEYGEVVLR